MKISSLRRERAIGGRRRVEYTRREGYTQGSLYRLTNSPRSFEDERHERARFAKETRRRNKRGVRVCVRVWGGRKRSGQRERKQKRRGAIRSMATLPARSPHTMRAPVLTSVPPCACCPSSLPPSPPLASFSALEALSLSLSLPPSLSSCIRKFAIHLTLPGATIRLIAPLLDRERATSSPGSNRIVEFLSNQHDRFASTFTRLLFLFFFFPPFSSSLFFFFFFCSSRFTDDKSKREIWQ